MLRIPGQKAEAPSDDCWYLFHWTGQYTHFYLELSPECQHQTLLNINYLLYYN